MPVIIDQEIGIILSVILGLLFGSFATMASHRIPKKEDLFIQRSRCPKCQHVLGFFDLFPVLSWLFSYGECRYCHKKISFRYPAIEILCATFFLLSFLKAGLSFLTIALFGLAVVSIIMITIDIEKKTIPDSLYIAFFILAFFYVIIDFFWHNRTFSYLLIPLGGLFFSLIISYIILLKGLLDKNKQKIILVAGLLLGIYKLPFYLLLIIMLELLIRYLAMITKKNSFLPLSTIYIILLFLCLLYIEYFVGLTGINTHSKWK